jgi:DNA-binding NarL/FixJ family response regulator
MENVINLVGKNLSFDKGISMTVDDDNLNNENIFLIGLDFNGSLENGSRLAKDGSASNKIPMLMLKIDTEKILSIQTSGTKGNSQTPIAKLHNQAESSSNNNPVKEIYSVDYNTSEKKLPHEELSYREMQVMKLIALGRARKEIAEELFLSISTINTYRARILEKMNMKNNAEIMRYAFQHKFVE